MFTASQRTWRQGEGWRFSYEMSLGSKCLAGNSGQVINAVVYYVILAC